MTFLEKIRKAPARKTFVLHGNRDCIRSDKELNTVDKTVADAAFQKYSKEILGEFLKQQGFLKWKTNAFVRLNSIDVLEYINLQKERYGSKTFTVNYALMPLYVPNEYMVTGFGDRLGNLIVGKDIWWDYADKRIAEVSFQNVTDAIEQFVLPWFQTYGDKELLKKRLLKDRKKGDGLPYNNQKWLESIDVCENRSEIILDNIRRLKLPKKLGNPLHCNSQKGLRG